MDGHCLLVKSFSPSLSHDRALCLPTFSRSSVISLSLSLSLSCSNRHTQVSKEGPADATDDTATAGSVAVAPSAVNPRLMDVAAAASNLNPGPTRSFLTPTGENFKFSELPIRTEAGRTLAAGGR